jgi:Helix-turn-helix
LNGQQTGHLLSIQQRLAAHRLLAGTVQRPTSVSALQALSMRMEGLSNVLRDSVAQRAGTFRPVEARLASDQSDATPGSDDARSRESPLYRARLDTITKQLSDVMELLAADDAVILDAVALIHSEVCALIAGSTSAHEPVITQGILASEESDCAGKAPVLARTLAAFLSERVGGASAEQFALAVLERTSQLYSTLIEEANQVPCWPSVEVPRVPAEDGGKSSDTATDWDAVLASRLESLVKGMSVREVAALTGLNRETVRRYLRGSNKPSAAFIVRMAHAFKVSTDWLYGLTS